MSLGSRPLELAVGLLSKLCTRLFVKYRLFKNSDYILALAILKTPKNTNGNLFGGHAQAIRLVHVI